MEIRMKVLLLGSKEYPAHFRTSACGGIEVHMESVVRHLLQKGVEVYLISRSVPGEKNVEHGINLHIYRVPCIESRLLRTVSLNLFASILSIFVIVKHRVELLHANDFTSGFFGSILKILLRRPLLLSAPTFGSLQPDWPLFIRGILAVFERFSISNSDHIFLFSPEDVRLVKRRFPKVGRLELLGNAVDVDEFAVARPPKASEMPLVLSPEIKVVVFIGRLVKSKGLDSLISAFQQVCLSVPSALIIVGDGPEAEQLREQVKQRQLEDQVFFVGRRRYVRDYLQAADLFVLPSLYEGFPISLLEAMASSKAVVASKVGAISSVIKDGVNGILVEPGDVEQLSKAMRLLLTEPELRARIGRSALETVESRYSWAHLSDRIYLAYAELAGRTSRDRDKEADRHRSQVDEQLQRMNEGQ